MRPRLYAVAAALLVGGGLLAFAAGQRSYAAPSMGESATQPVLRVAAAAALKFAMDDLVPAVAAANGHIAVRVSYGSSGNFFSQLSNGAPFDIFLSADADYPRQLTAAGLTLPGTDFLYAVGRLVVWAARPSALDVRALGIETLRQPAVRTIAIANAQHAPYGRAAEAALRSLGVYGAVRKKLVFGENVAQAAQFVQSRAADVGIIALSLAVAPTLDQKGQYWEIPPGAYPRLEQGGVILKRTRWPEDARAFRAFILGATGRAILERYGFLLPAEK